MHGSNRITQPHAQGFAGRGPKGYIRPDGRIYEEACEQLTAHDAIDASDIELSVVRGFVTLTGSVRTLRERVLSEQIVQRVLGTSGVLCRIIVRPFDGTIEDKQRDIW